jgi:hypothetical protein
MSENLEIYHREMALHRKAAAERRAQGIMQFDGCPHYERASQAMADETLAMAERMGDKKKSKQPATT